MVSHAICAIASELRASYYKLININTQRCTHDADVWIILYERWQIGSTMHYAMLHLESGDVISFSASIGIARIASRYLWQRQFVIETALHHHRFLPD